MARSDQRQRLISRRLEAAGSRRGCATRSPKGEAWSAIQNKITNSYVIEYLYKYNSSSAARGRRTIDDLRGNHTIAAFMFCAIEPLIGSTQKCVEGVSIAPELRHPDTDGDVDRRSGSDLECIAFDG